MKELHLIESETPGVTVKKFKTLTAIATYAKNSKFEKSSMLAFKLYKKSKMYNNKKILKIYWSPWNCDEYFIKYFM